MKKTSLFPTTLACLVVVSFIFPAAKAQQSDQAKNILEATGVKGGVVVHIGCGDGRLTAALRAGDSYIVQGLDYDAQNVEKAREHIRSLGLYGKVSIDHLRGAGLPYIDNFVNLIVSEDLGDIAMGEVLRVLAPNGVAYIRKAGEWFKAVKERPAEIDDWTHYLYDASGNAVAKDSVVGPPRRMQWVGSPKWARSHEHSASLNALVSANGRIFYIMDEGPRDSRKIPSSSRPSFS
ncbi:MAG: class I SAM-dependent methyltransferase [Planctomycetota bacterium]|jgi:SAM-dependent methyltransferase